MKKIAREAVKRVYGHGSGADDKGQAAQERKQRLSAQRQALGKQFREKYLSTGALGPNALPHFIGVWDTVAAVGVSPPVARAFALAGVVAAVVVSAAFSVETARVLDWDPWAAFGVAVAALMLFGYGAFVLLRLKFVTGLPGFRWYETVHLVSFRMAFFDRSLNPNVRYARHAIAIDECRADFDRVPWKNDAQPPNREIAEGAWFRQLWFAGNHSDIGGSYPENESRLSDIALEWMVGQAKRAGLIVDQRYLKLFGRHNGQQHDECREGIRFMGMTFRWREHVRRMVDNATLHPTVSLRFNEPSVLVYDKEVPYRPAALAKHERFVEVYEREAALALKEG